MSIFLLLMVLSCRNEIEDESSLNLPNRSEAKELLKKGDTIPENPSSGSGETEPPRKDLLQWKQIP